MLCEKAGKLETGGVLVGRYNKGLDEAVVTSVLPPPPDSRFGRRWFVRGISGLAEVFRAKWRRGEYYLGEWHFHPGGYPDASDDDESEAFDLARAPSYHCPEVVLVIVARRGDIWELSARVFERGGSVPVLLAPSPQPLP